MADFIIRIPRVSVAVSEAELVQLLVENGQHVEEGTPIYVIATEKVEQEVEAGASGTVHWTAEAGGIYDIGVRIGVINRAQPGDDAGRARPEEELGNHAEEKAWISARLANESSMKRPARLRASR